MSHLSTSRDPAVELADNAHDHEPPSIAFSGSSARLSAPSAPGARFAIVSALALGVLSCLALLRGGAPSSAQGAASNDLETFVQGCEQGDAVACNNLGVIYEHGYGVTPDARTAFRAFERACLGGSPDGCGNLGVLYERGEGTAADLSEAVRLYEQACNTGAALGCSNLGALYAHGKGVARDATRARGLFALACDTGSAAGCSNLMQSGSH